MVEISWLQIVLANVALMLGACLQGVAGYGVGTLSAPLVFLINPAFLPGPMIANATLLNALMLIRNRGGVSFSPVRHAIEGGIGGIILAGLTLHMLSSRGFDVAFGVLILMAVALSSLGLKPRLNRLNSTIAGWVSGYMGTITAIGGPPMALVYQSETGQRVRANLSAFFLFTSVVSLMVLLPAGKLNWTELQLVGWSFPGIFIGFWLSKCFVNRLPYDAMRPLVLTIAAVAGIAAIIRAFLA